MPVRQFDGTLTRVGEQQVAIVLVDEAIVRDPLNAARTLATYQNEFFRGVTTVLLGRSGTGTQEFFGPPALVAELVKIDPRRFQWRRYKYKTK